MAKVNDLDLDDILDEFASGEPAVVKLDKLETGIPAGTKTPVKGNADDPIEDDEEEEEEQEEEEDIDDATDTDDTDDDSDEEIDFAAPLAKEIHEKLGFEFDFDEKEFNEAYGKGADSLVNFIHHVIEQNAKPEFENETAQRYYEYIAKGGNPEDLNSIIETKTKYSSIKEETIKEDESLQRSVYSEYLKITNPDRDAAWIKAKVDRAENGGLLEEESLDALESVSKYYKKQEELQLKSVKDREAQQKKAVDEYWKAEKEAITKTDELAGVKITDGTKQKFLKYWESGKFNEEVKDPKVLRELAFVKFMGIENYKKAVNSKNARDINDLLRRQTSDGMKLTGKDRRPASATSSDIRDLEI